MKGRLLGHVLSLCNKNCTYQLCKWQSADSVIGQYWLSAKRPIIGRYQLLADYQYFLTATVHVPFINSCACWRNLQASRKRKAQSAAPEVAASSSASAGCSTGVFCLCRLKMFVSFTGSDLDKLNKLCWFIVQLMPLVNVYVKFSILH